ncbi:hypothetical protein Tco_0094673, partial [Tanacetum coccineum]
MTDLNNVSKDNSGSWVSKRVNYIDPQVDVPVIEMVKIYTDNNVADLLTKAFDMKHRAITTAASLDKAHDSDNIIRTQTTAMPNVDIPRGMDT